MITNSDPAWQDSAIESLKRLMGMIFPPCYMIAQSIREVGAGIEKLAAKIMEMA